MQLHVRKARAGSSTRGFTWDHDGAVVAVPYDLAVELVAIPDAGFSIVEAPQEPEQEPDVPAGKPVAEPPAEEAHAVTEPAPTGAELSEAPTATKPAGKPKTGK